MAEYRVAVDLVLTGEIMAALAAVAGAQGLGGIKSAVTNIQEGFEGWTAALIGGAGIAVGVSVIGALSKVADAAAKTQDAIAKMRLLGLPDEQIRKGVETAQQVGMRVGAPPDVSQEMLNRIQGIVRDPEHSRALLEPMLRMGVILRQHGKDWKSVDPILKLLEETNIATDPGRAKDLPKVLERITKAIEATQGTVTPEALQLATVYARTARYGFTTPEALAQPHPFLTDILPMYVQMSGRAGQGGGGANIMAEYTKTVQGILKGASVGEAQKLGILDKTGFLKDSHLASINPYEWTQQVLVPALKAQGLTDSLKQQPEIAQQITRLMGTRAAADPITEFALGGRGYRGENAPFEKFMEQMNRSPGLSGAEDLQKTSPTAAMQRLSAEWEHLWNVIGSALTQDKLNIIRSMSDTIEDLARKASQIDPKSIHNVAEALAALGVAAASAGVVGLAAALGGVPGVLTLMASAATAMSPTLRELAGEMSGNLLTAIQGIVHAAKDATAALSAFWDKMKSWTDWLGITSKGAAPEPGKIPPGFAPTQPLPHDWKTHPEKMPGMNGLLNKSSWEPSGGGGKSVAINNVIYLDGSAIARAVHDYMIAGMEHDHQAPYFDGRSAMTTVAHQPITT